MSVNLFALNNLIAKNLVTHRFTPPPVVATVYEAISNSVLFIGDTTTGYQEVDAIVSRQGSLVAVFDDGTMESLPADKKVVHAAKPVH